MMIDLMINYITLRDIFAFTPEIIFLVGILILLVHFVFISTKIEYLTLVEYSSKISVYILAIVQVFNFYSLQTYQNENLRETFFSNSLVLTKEIIIFKIILIFIAILIMLFSIKYFKDVKLGYFEYNILFLCSLLGCLITLSANDLIILYISLEMQALAFYIMATLRKSAQSTEAGLKYFIVGSFSSAVLLFGISLIILTTGHHNFDNIKEFLYFYEYGPSQLNFFINIYNPIIIIGTFLIFIALFIKLSIAPFHEWVADIYEGIMTPTALFFSTIPKISLFFIVARLFQNVFISLFDVIQPFFAICCILSLILGSLNAFKQQNIKRFLAYSSVNHFGFMLIGLIVGTKSGIDAAFLYLNFYIILTFGMWSNLMLLSYKSYTGVKEKLHQLTKITELSGLATLNPGVTFLIFTLLLSMGGIPPLAGFSAKASIFFVLIEKCSFFIDYTNISAISFNLILIIAFFSSILSIFYYIRIIKILFLHNKKQNYLPIVFSYENSLISIILALICSFNLFSFVLFL